GSGQQCSDRYLGRLIPAIHTDARWPIRRAAYRDSKVQQLITHSTKGRSRARRHQRADHTLAPNDRRQVLIAELSDKSFYAHFAFMNVSQLISPVSRLLQGSRQIPLNTLRNRNLPFRHSFERELIRAVFLPGTRLHSSEVLN